MAVPLCAAPRAGELCAPVRFLLRGDSLMELTARPVDVRIDVLPAGAEHADARTRKIGTSARHGRHYDVVGTYLGVVAGEN